MAAQTGPSGSRPQAASAPPGRFRPEVPRREAAPPLSAGPATRRWQTAAAWMAAGLVLGILAAVFWFSFGPGATHQQQAQKDAGVQMTALQKQIQALETEVETSRLNLENLQTGNRRLNDLLNAFREDWDKAPEKPSYMKTPDGVILYWTDSMVWRKYYVYEGKGTAGALYRYSRLLKRPFIYLKNPKPGFWRYAVSALNKEGKETAQSPALTLSFPLE